MPKVAELVRQGRHEDIWQMCCGFVKMDIAQFMSVQKRLLLDQIDSLNHSGLGRKIMAGAWPQTIDDFRKELPLTTYEDYCPELAERKSDILPSQPAQWVHTSGRSGDHSCKWIPLTPAFIREMSPILCGIGLLSASDRWGDLAPMVEKPKMMYTVAPRPYISGALAAMLQEQTPSLYYPSLGQAENLTFEERIKLGFEEALSGGLDFFFGLSVVLMTVGNKFSQSMDKVSIHDYIFQPRALWRLSKGMVKSRMGSRRILPKDIWSPKGIITSGLDSSVYREKIKEYWGRYPLDIYACTEGGVIATQTWNNGEMTFIPNLNFLEFIPESEHFKWQIDHQYQPKTLLLDEVKSGECYELVITNLHGGALVRYRIGDMIRITSLRNEALSINIPQMTFERRADDLLDFATVRLSEKTIWQAIEKTGLPYEDWVAFKKPGELTLNILIEPQDGHQISENELEKALYNLIMQEEVGAFDSSQIHKDAIKTTKLDIKVVTLPSGAFARFSAHRRSEGADIAHIKPPHVNPSERVLSMLLDSWPSVSETVRPAPSQATVSVR